jgi:hypothetical protein
MDSPGRNVPDVGNIEGPGDAFWHETRNTPLPHDTRLGLLTPTKSVGPMSWDLDNLGRLGRYGRGGRARIRA